MYICKHDSLDLVSWIITNLLCTSIPFPTRNVAHVTCMLHAKNKKFHDACLAHVSILTNMHVSCNMQGFGTFYMHVTCVKHAYNMHMHVMTCMQHACYNMHTTCVKHARTMHKTCAQHARTMHIRFVYP